MHTLKTGRAIRILLRHGGASHQTQTTQQTLKKGINMSQARREFSEKRNFIRMRVETPANIHLDAEGIHIAGICRDLSGGGMLVEVNQAIANGTSLDVTIASDHNHSPMLKAKAVVRRVSEGPNSQYTLGLEILELAD